MLLLAGPLVAILGVVAIVFVMRHKSVEKRSMYSARRSQIEHKVRAARQRTLAPHGHAPKPAEEQAPAQASPFDQRQQVQPTITYQTPAYEAPPVAPPPVRPAREQPAAAPMPWDTPAAPEPAPSGWDFPPATTAPPEPAYTPPPAARPEPMPMPSSEPSWTPAPKPAEPLAPAQTAAPAASSTSAGSWSIVSTSKESAATGAPETRGRDKGKDKKKKKDEAAAASDWSLASGAAADIEAEESEPRRPSGTIIAIAQYAVLVVGLVMVLVGVLVMVANSHVT